MTDPDTIIRHIATLRASLNLETEPLEMMERRALRAHVEHCMLDLQGLLSRLIAGPGFDLDAIGASGAGRRRDEPDGLS